MHTSIPVVYPHRVSFFQDEGCDVCGDSYNTYFIEVNKYIGFRCCKNDICHDVVKEWLKVTTKGKEELENKYGTDLKIQRSNDNIENMWYIASDAFQEHKDGEFWVEVTNSNNESKLVRLSELDLLNIS